MVTDAKIPGWEAEKKKRAKIFLEVFLPDSLNNLHLPHALVFGSVE